MASQSKARHGKARQGERKNGKGRKERKSKGEPGLDNERRKKEKRGGN